MNHINENIIENFAIELFNKLGYLNIYAPDVGPDSENPKRESFSDVLLIGRMQQAVRRINSGIPKEAQAINYCEANNIADGILINFGAKSQDFKRVYNKRLVNPKIK